MRAKEENRIYISIYLFISMVSEKIILSYPNTWMFCAIYVLHTSVEHGKFQFLNKKKSFY